ncbi:ABC transporter substrate-binding protein [Pseudoalteromonas tunicata]|uniref:ABC transporter substrate-binding protein n=1 Tax=Pseudoalteromonas tunicata TaxID=314281 RepID=UPI0027402BB0|nr:ABC transporter substrate-binding protein [Pseudoalteromonas tunicata]MDP4983388.1 ABC transporter substrate-binding protein [Pseudoalteromonas tunicata]MDP5212731.1 ABC transporter substrate-binding protein [Pseudoalteromonas tunicata]
MRYLILAMLVLFTGQLQAQYDVVLQLKWQHQFQFAGYYMALENGYYREKGINVTIIAANPDDVDTVPKVLSGQADFGIANSGLLLHRLAGEQLVAMAAIFQSSPYCWLVKGDSTIRSVADFKGKRVGFFNREESAELFSMLAQNDISQSDLIPETTKVSLQNWIDGDVDVLPAYVSNEPFTLKQKNIDYRLLCPKRYGLNTYSDVLFTRQDLIDQNPQMVLDFYLASIKGWKDAINHPQKVIDIIKSQYQSKKSRAHLAFEAQELLEFIHPEQAKLGQMSSSRWRAIAMMHGAGKQKIDEHLNGFIYKPQKLASSRLSWMHIIAIMIILISLPSYYRLLFKHKKSKSQLETTLN